MSHYRLLGVAENATLHEIRAAYRRIALLCHPDRSGGDPGAESLFHEATAAYRTLSDPDRRRRYDLENGLVDTVADLFARNRTGRRVLKSVLPAARSAPRDGRAMLRVSEDDARAAGGRRRRIPDGTHGAHGQVEIVRSGKEAAATWYQADGLGEPGRNGGEPGPLWILILSRGEPDGD